MKTLNNRQLLILNTLLNNEEPVSAQQVGNSLDLSARTVRYNLNQIENWLKDNSLELENKPNVGLFIPASKDQRNNLLKKINCDFNSTEKNLGQINRCLWIEFELLNQGQPYKALNFQYSLGISHNTCSKDLHLIEAGLADWGLTLKRTPGLGTEICGSEIKYRYRLIYIIRSIIDENDLFTLCLWDKIRIKSNYTEQSILKSKILHDIQNWNLYDAWRTLKKLDSKFNLAFTDTELVRHTLYIALTCKRINSKHFIEIPSERLENIKKAQIFNELKLIFSSFGANKCLPIFDSEIGQLAMEISAGKNGTIALGTLELSLEEITPIAEWILVSAGQELGCNLLNPTVIKMLSQHLMLSISRLEHDLPVTNPILEDIENKYSTTLDIVRRAIEQHSQLREINFPLSEIGYIALYVEMAKIEAGITREKRKKVVVVCPTGGITVGMLLLRIKNELPTLDVVDVLSIRSFNQKNFDSKIDAVITTSPSLSHKNLEVICVNPLLERKDVVKIINQLGLGEINE